jgi:hypothetical protein
MAQNSSSLVLVFSAALENITGAEFRISWHDGLELNRIKTFCIHRRLPLHNGSSIFFASLVSIRSSDLLGAGKFRLQSKTMFSRAQLAFVALLFCVRHL